MYYRLNKDKTNLDEKMLTCSNLNEIIKNNSDIVNQNIVITNMLVRHILARYSYLTKENILNIPEVYRSYYEKVHKVFKPYYCLYNF